MEKSQRRYARRLIHVGARVVAGVLCPRCIQRTVIFPEASMEAHLADHSPGMPTSEPVARYRRGRPPGSSNRYQMSSTGVERKRGIRPY